MMKRTIVILIITLTMLGLFMATLATAIRSRHTPVASASEAQVDLPPQETAARMETPAPVAPGSNRVTVDFSGIQPVIK